MEGEKPKGGRPRKGPDRLETETFRATAKQRKAWRLAAEKAGLPYSEWVRLACDRAARLGL